MRIVEYYDKATTQKLMLGRNGKLQEMIMEFYNSGRPGCRIDMSTTDEYKDHKAMCSSVSGAARKSGLPVRAKSIDETLYLVRTDM